MPSSLAAGVDVVCVSGDKMLGGPQAGIVLGRKALVDRLRTHPLMRALRVDKLTYAALEGTLVEHWAGRAHADGAGAADAARAARADPRPRRGTGRAARSARNGGPRSIDGESAIGGGSAPGVTVPTALVRLSRDGWSADELETWLRERDTPIIARIQDDAVVLDLRTVAEGDDAVAVELLTSPSPEPPGPSPA